MSNTFIGFPKVLNNVLNRLKMSPNKVPNRLKMSPSRLARFHYKFLVALRPLTEVPKKVNRLTSPI